MDVISSVTVANLAERSLVAVVSPGPIWFVKFWEKKLVSPLGFPFTEYMDTMLAEGTLLLRNLSPIPGARAALSLPGSTADESLNKPLSEPLKIPVNGWFPVVSRDTLATAPTVWIYFTLSGVFDASPKRLQDSVGKTSPGA